jgi:hypothetical protein
MSPVASTKRGRGPGKSKPPCRARAQGRKVQSIVGIGHRIYRRLKEPEVASEGYEECTATDARRRVYSFVHQFGEKCGFKSRDGILPNGPLQEEAATMFRTMSEPHSGPNDPAVVAQSAFECYVLQAMSDTDPYHIFLTRCKELLRADAGLLACAIPSDILLKTYIVHLRNQDVETAEKPAGRSNSSATIRKNIGLLSGVVRRFRGDFIKKAADIKKMCNRFLEEDCPNPAPAWLLEIELPKLWDALWNKIQGNYQWKVKLWCRLLVQIGTIARASDVTEYCPHLGSVKFPVHENDWFKDGSPAYIRLEWTNWKHCPSKMKGKPYYIRLYANPKDQRFCPVFWLQAHWMHYNPTDSDAPIIQKFTSETYRKHLKALFKAADLPDSSSHSVRRSAAQWAFRCCEESLIVRNVGRWVSLDNVVAYLCEGTRRLTEYLDEHGLTIDPIGEFWFFNSRTMVSCVKAD